MAYKITVLKNEIVKVKNYEVAQVAYKTDDGKTKGMKVLSFVQKDVFAVLKDVVAGDVLDANFEKNDKGFWQFANLSKTGATAPVQSDSKVSTPQVSKGNWETSEERAKRQVMIVRQSSLSNTINYFELTGHKKASPEDVIAVSRLFEKYVLDQPTGEVS